MHAAFGGRNAGRGNTRRSTSKQRWQGFEGNRSVSDGSVGWKGMQQQQLFAAVVLLAPFIGWAQSEGTFVKPPLELARRPPRSRPLARSHSHALSETLQTLSLHAHGTLP